MNLLIITQKVDQTDPILGFFCRWIIEFSKYFNHIEVVCLSAGTHDLPENVTVHSLGKNSGAGRIVIFLRFVSLIIKLNKKYNSVFIHMNQIYIILGGLVWKLLNKKIGFWYAHKQVTISLKLAEKITDIIFTPSQESFRIPSNKVLVTGHGIPTEIFTLNNVKPPQITISSVGRITPVKNLETLINAGKILLDKKIDFSIKIIGCAINNIDRAYQKKLQKQIIDLKLGSNIFFHDAVSNDTIVNQIQNSSVIVNTSLTGSADKAVLEAMSCGVPVITSNESFKKVLPPLLLCNQNDPLDLAEKIIGIINTPKTDLDMLRKNLRENILLSHDLKKLIKNISHNLT